MKKISTWLSIIILSVLVFLLGFNQKIGKQPNTYYQVYLDDELIGMIESKQDLEDYINEQANTIRTNIKEYKLMLDAIETFENQKSLSSKESNQEILEDLLNSNLSELDKENLNYYKEKKLYEYSSESIQDIKDYIDTNSIYEYVNDVYTPNGIEIKKVYTYHSDIKSTEEIYKDIISRKSCTIAGYLFTIKRDEELGDIQVYTLDRKIFSDAIENLITIFVDEEDYENYKKDSQNEISTTGSIIENIYVEEDITYKAVNIPVQEKIYTSANDLAAYLLYGDEFSEKTVKVETGDSIESISFDNQISVQEFLIFNPQYTSRDNLLVTGSDVTISTIDPKIQIVVETYEVVDKETDYSTVEEYDETLSRGSVVVKQDGINGLDRVSQNVKSVNGQITYVDPVNKETIKNSTSKIISIGTKYIPNVGSLTSWGWPTNPGYTLSSYYGYRLAVFGEGNFHSGLDIAGTGYGSPVYAANNGTIQEMKILRDKNGNYTSYGIYILINHNNGYYSLYGHMSRFASGISEGSTVSRGQTIGYVGSTGWATGPHLHFEIRTCAAYACTTNPLRYY